MITKAEILAQAKELLAKGWHQGSFYKWETDEDDEPVGNEPMAYCSIGALMEATNELARRRNPGDYVPRTLLDTEYEARDILAKAAGLNNRGEIATWNDSPTRTKDEVLATFDKAIEMSKV